MVTRECPQSDICSDSATNRWCVLFHKQDQEIKEKKWEGLLSLLIPESLLAKFLLPVSVTLGSISAKLSSQRKKVSTGGCSKGSIKLADTLATFPGASHASESVKHYCKDYCTEWGRGLVLIAEGCY